MRLFSVLKTRQLGHLSKTTNNTITMFMRICSLEFNVSLRKGEKHYALWTTAPMWLETSQIILY